MIESYDKDNMLKLLLEFPEQCINAGDIAQKFDVPDEYRNTTNIVIAGMGGSAIGGDLAKVIFNAQSPIPIIVNRNYTIPEFINDKTLFIGVSYSGNTEETLSAFKAAREKSAKLLAITSDGKLKELAIEVGAPYLIIPGGQPPRASLAYLFIPLLSIISRLGFAPDFNLTSALLESAEILRKMANDFAPEKSSLPKELAYKLHNHIPIIYASQDLDAVATRWKGQFCENSKMLAYHNVFPEMNHNEIEGWLHPAELTRQCQVVILRDESDHQRIQKRMDITRALIKEHVAQITCVKSHGKSLLARLLSLIYIGDFASFYLAILNKINPTPVGRIGRLKDSLGPMED